MKEKINREHAILAPQISFLEICRRYPEKRLVTFQSEKYDTDFLTGKTLESKMKALGNALQKELAPQEKVILIFPQGLEYIYSLLACLYANLISIPVQITDSSYDEQVVERINFILKDSQAACILTNFSFKELLKTKQLFSQVSILSIDELLYDDLDGKKARPQASEDIALILYTSGSVSQPKGIILSCDNLMYQALTGADQWEISEESCVVSWMPQFHNFGLHFNILAPLLKGASSVILSPSSFIKDPKIWFKAIDKYQATHTAAPNFAFDYCCSSIDMAWVKEISLHSLKEIICGGEPVRKKTYENFFEKFQSLGLEDNVFCPHYGLSEAGSVTTKRPGQPVRCLSLSISSLENGKVKHTDRKIKSKSVVSCGEIGKDIKVLIINPGTCEPSLPGEIGEIWVKSSSVGKGYLNQTKESESIFSGVLKNMNETGFLRTSDLGFIEDNNLYIAGREKEVIIIHGKNHYPVDIEWTIKNNIPRLDLPIAVFSYEFDQQEKVIVVQEVEASKDESEYRRIVQELLIAVSENHGIEVYEIYLVKSGSIPKTGSGKVQRKACRASYINQELSIVYQYKYATHVMKTKGQESIQNANQNILETLKNEVFLNILKIELDRLEKTSLFSELGIDSIQYVQISKKIEEIFKIQFTPSMLFKYRSFEELAQHISNESKVSKLQTYDRAETESYIFKESQHVTTKDIAIIGMSCNLPGGAIDPECFWENLIQQKDCITPISQSRPGIISDYVNHYGGASESFPQWGGFIENTEMFDASFFGISPLEAESMDPQQRKLLELTWSVIEDSGYNPRQLAGENVGVFVGVHSNDYAELFSRQPELMEIYGAYMDSGLHMSMISNRVSRWFNFHGPSEIINTACSSSLVAVHHAVESIYRGECSLAIAGGVNIILTSRVYCASYKANMLSKDGRCKTFDHQADGFVRAEGYGALLLKPLSKAVKDKDSIYGVIKGAVINHDGQSNSLRAPNLNAQKELIKVAYQRSKLPLETISYIEAHGTGTPLGDPIELQALQEAFQEIDSDLPKTFCGLGTVKTNIGHCESAAGIAGLIKVLLSLKYRIMPGILHFEKLNQYISLDDSPFYIVDKNQKWERFKDSEGREIPLRAGVSSFGFGGVNAHIILEEYVSSNNIQQQRHFSPNKGKNVLVPISAKNKDSLYAYIGQLLTFIRRHMPNGENSININLFEISYTLQAGREAMKERVVFLVRDLDELVTRLGDFMKRKEHIEGCWQGDGKDSVSLLSSDEQDKWIAKGKLDKIAQYWALGGIVNWELLYDQERPCRINLPTYFFARERYWISELDVGANIIERTKVSTSVYPHPLLHQNTSDFFEQRFSSIFTGREFFIADHVVNGQHILPGAVYLEMARGAMEQSAGDQGTMGTGILLKNVIWSRPVIVQDQEVQLHIGLSYDNSGEISYKIYSEPSVVYSQGDMVFVKTEKIPVLDIEALLAKCRKNTMSSNSCYEILRAMGIDYGSGYQGIEMLYIGSSQVLAKLSLPSSVYDTRDQFVLHPSLMDSAFQATIGLMMERGNIKPVLAFGLQEIEIFHNCTSKMWAFIRYSDGCKVQERIQKFDIDLCDETGKVSVRIRGFSTRALGGEAQMSNASNEILIGSSSDPLVGNVMLAPMWDVVQPEKVKVFPNSVEGIVIVGGSEGGRNNIWRLFPKAYALEIQSITSIDKIVEKLEEYGYVNHIVWIAPYNILGSMAEDALVENQKYGVLLLFRMVKALLRLGYGNRNLGWSLITINAQSVFENERADPSHASIHGFVGSMAKEYPNWKIRLTDLESDYNWPVEDIFTLPTDPMGNAWSYRGQEWYRQKLIPVRPVKFDRTLYRPGGVYVVIGGAGGIGEAWSEYMIRTYRAQIIWIGRRQKDEVIQAKMDSLAMIGPTPHYMAADASDHRALEQAYEDIKRIYSRINGVIHSAVGVMDQSLANMEENHFRAGLSSKVDVSVSLAQVFQKEPLDFVLFFSSIAAFEKGLGQSSYTSSCTFKDALAKQLSLKWPCAVKVVNWGYWGNVGIGAAVPNAFKNRLVQAGIGNIELSEAMEAIETLLAGNINQIVFMKTTKPLDMEGVSAGELIETYPAGTASNIQSLKDHMLSLVKEIKIPKV